MPTEQNAESPTMKQDFLIELGTEELPPKALYRLGEALHDTITDRLQALSLHFSSSQWFATPRRLAVHIEQLDIAQAEQRRQQRGPALKAAFDEQGLPTPAAQGFAKSVGVSVDELERLETNKGTWLAHTRTQAGQATETLLPDIVQTAIQRLPIPKRMTWGTSKVEFVRPVHWVVMLFGDAIIDASILGLQTGNTTQGHRFHCTQPLTLEHPSAYEKMLKQHGHVIANYAERKAQIKRQVEDLAQQHTDGTALIDADLLDEVTGLVEWPVALLGSFDKEFLEVPQEALISAMQNHQKYFPILDSQQRLLPFFITISNIQSSDPDVIVQGNERVIRPRLADAKFFFDNDRKRRLTEHNETNKNVIFQAALGSVYDKAQRVAQHARDLATRLNLDADQAYQAGLLSKADLATDMVSEFPELQGIMGRYYALHEGINNDTAIALDEHYRPRFSGDAIPSNATAAVVAIADKIDTLIGILGIGKFPSGDKDPFALRRTTLGLLRIIIEKNYAIDLNDAFRNSATAYADRLTNKNVVSDALDFVQDRYRAWFQDQGIDSDVIIAVQRLKPSAPLDVHRRIHAVNHFKGLDSAASLASANKRVSNILAKAKQSVDTRVDEHLLQQPQEHALMSALTEKQQQTAALLQQSLEQRNYTDVLNALAELQTPVDDFFTHVMVNAEDPSLQRNRLAIVKTLQQLFLQVADVGELLISS